MKKPHSQGSNNPGNTLTSSSSSNSNPCHHGSGRSSRLWIPNNRRQDSSDSPRPRNSSGSSNSINGNKCNHSSKSSNDINSNQYNHNQRRHHDCPPNNANELPARPARPRHHLERQFAPSRLSLSSSCRCPSQDCQHRNNNWRKQCHRRPAQPQMPQGQPLRTGPHRRPSSWPDEHLRRKAHPADRPEAIANNNNKHGRLGK